MLINTFSLLSYEQYIFLIQMISFLILIRLLQLIFYNQLWFWWKRRKGICFECDYEFGSSDDKTYSDIWVLMQEGKLYLLCEKCFWKRWKEKRSLLI